MPIPGKSQNDMFGLVGCSYTVGTVVVSVTPTWAAFSSSSLSLKEQKTEWTEEKCRKDLQLE